MKFGLNNARCLPQRVRDRSRVAIITNLPKYIPSFLASHAVIGYVLRRRERTDVPDCCLCKVSVEEARQSSIRVMKARPARGRIYRYHSNDRLVRL